MAVYFAVIHKDATSDYGISFPDLPGCVSAASSLEELDIMGREALKLHIEGMLEDKESLPTPSDYQSVYEQSAADAGFVGVTLVAVKPRTKRVRVNISLPEDDLKHIDALAQQYGLDRSGFMLFAAKNMQGAASRPI